MFGFLKLFFINFLVLCVGVALLEAVVLIFEPRIVAKARICWYVLCNANREYDTGFNGTVVYTKDAYGLRGRRSAHRDIDILIMGGSTSDQRYVADNMTWDYLLEQSLAEDGIDVEIANAGIDGQSTFGHLWSLDNWLPLIPELKPKYIVYYVGINDVMPKLHNDRYDFQNHVESWRTRLNKYKQRTLTYIAIQTFTGVKQARKAGVVHDYNRIEDFTALSKESTLDIGAYQKIYLDGMIRPRLKAIAEKTRQLGAQPVFITQRTALWKVHNGSVVAFVNPTEKPVREVTFENQLFRFSPYDQFSAESLVANEILGFCDAQNLQCFDGFSHLRIDAQSTYDLIHTNSVGSRRVANDLKPFFESLLGRTENATVSDRGN